MLSPEGLTQTSDTTERITRPSHSIQRPAMNGHRHSKPQQQQTDSLPKLNGDTPIPGGKIAGRSVAQLREENRRLRSELEELRTELQQHPVTTARPEETPHFTQVQVQQEIARIHRGYQQEIEHYRAHLSHVVEERDQLELRYQELYAGFQETVEEEAHKIVMEATRTLKFAPSDTTSGFLPSIMKSLELEVRQVADQNTAETLYVMREAQRKAHLLEEERQQIAVERQNVLAMQASAKEQVQLREQLMESRLRIQWTLVFTATVTLLLLLFPILQLASLSIGRVPLTPVLLTSLLAPLLICIVIAFVFARLRSKAKEIITSAPHRVKATTKTPAGKGA